MRNRNYLIIVAFALMSCFVFSEANAQGVFGKAAKTAVKHVVKRTATNKGTARAAAHAANSARMRTENTESVSKERLRQAVKVDSIQRTAKQNQGNDRAPVKELKARKNLSIKIPRSPM